MAKSVLVMVLFGLIAVNYVSAVSKCYVCEDCETPEGEKTCTKEEENFPQKKEDVTSEIPPPETEGKGDEEDTTTAAPANNFNCFKVITKIEDKTKIQRGCTTQASCEKVDFGEAVEASCIICDDEDSCNSATNIQRFAMGVVIFIALMVHL